MNKNFLRTACISVTVLALACTMGCGKSVDKGAVTSDSAAEVTTAAEYRIEPVDYDKYEFTIFSAGNVAYDDFKYDEASEVVLDNAQYQRKKMVENDFNISITSTVQKAYSLGNGPGFQKINQAVLAGECFYDAALIGGYDVSVLAYNDLLYDLRSIPEIKLDQRWWDQGANRDLTIRGTMFFTTGDITTQDNDAIFTLLFNKELISSYNLTTPYEYVKNNNWTLETFAELVKSVDEDLNSDDKRDANDRYGLLVWDDAIMGIIEGIGEKCATINSDGKIELTLYNERTVDALEKYFDIIYDRTTAICYQRVLSTGSGIWNNNQGLFWMSTLGNVPALRNMDADFGIVPYPKKDTTQKDYFNTISPYNSQFYCVPKVQNDVQMTGRVLEALAYYGYKTVTPAYYEKTLVGQSMRDSESSEMLDIILSTMAYDLGYYYQVGNYTSNLIYMVRAYDRNFTSTYEKNSILAETKLKEINEFFDKTVASWEK